MTRHSLGWVPPPTPEVTHILTFRLRSGFKCHVIRPCCKPEDCAWIVRRLQLLYLVPSHPLLSTLPFLHGCPSESQYDLRTHTSSRKGKHSNYRNPPNLVYHIRCPRLQVFHTKPPGTRSQDVGGKFGSGISALSSPSSLKYHYNRPSLQIIGSRICTEQLRRRILRSLRKTCGSRRVLPRSHYFPGRLHKTGRRALFGGGTADVWKVTDDRKTLYAAKVFRANNGEDHKIKVGPSLVKRGCMTHPRPEVL